MMDAQVVMREITKLQLADQTMHFREHHTSLQEYCGSHTGFWY